MPSLFGQPLRHAQVRWGHAKTRHSSSCCEPFLNLVHKWMAESNFSQFDEVFEDRCLPGCFTNHSLLAAIFQIEGSCLRYAAEEHKCMSAIPVDGDQVRRKHDHLIGGFQRSTEITNRDESVGQIANFTADPENGLRQLVIAIGAT